MIDKKMMVMSALDQQIYVDDINIQSDEIIGSWVSQNDESIKQPSFQYFTMKFEQGGSFCSTWPYVTFEGITKGFMWLINLNKPQVIHRIQLPPDCIEVVDAEISSTYELFIMCQAIIGQNNRKQGYKLLEVDLDSYLDPVNQQKQQFIIQSKLAFTKDDIVSLLKTCDVEEPKTLNKGPTDKKCKKSIYDMFDDISEYDIMKGMRLLDIYIRQSNQKDKGTSDQKLIVFVMFTGFVVSYIQGQPGANGTDLQFVCLTDSEQFQRFDEDSVVIQKKVDPNEEKIVIYKLETKYSSYSLSKFFDKQLQNEKLVSYCVDNKANMLLILSKIKSNNKMNKIKLLRIIDLASNQCVFKNEFTMNEVYGRMKANTFVLDNGHMYFNNCVVKIRYDLISKGIDQEGPLRDEDILDTYDKILELEHDESIMISFPYLGWRSNKIIYLVHQNFNDFPSIYKDEDRFLHKKIIILPYLHERKIHIGRFKKDHQYFCLAIDDTQHQESIIEAANIQDCQGNPQLLQYRAEWRKKIMVTINFTTKKLYAYKYNGLMTKRCVFQSLADKFGNPEAVSADGLNFLFVKKDQVNIFLTVLRLNLANNFKEGFEILTKFEQINLKKVEQTFLKQSRFKKSSEILAKCSQIPNKCPKKVNYKFDINCDEGQFDIAVCLYFLGVSSVYLLVDYQQDDKIQDWKRVDDHLDSKDELQIVKNFSINKKFIVYWTNYEIFYKEIANLSKEFVKIDLPIQPSKDSQGYVHSVYTGDADEKIAIMIKTKLEDGNCYLITWQTNQQKEIDAFEIPDDTKVFFDANGDIYSTHQNRVLICSQKVRLTCFQTDYLKESYGNCKNEKMSLSKGHHIDEEFHRWIFLHEYILLPYSYMTFAIKQKFVDLKTYSHPDFIFDIEQFNFIFDKMTTFTMDEQQCLNYKYMKYLLENMERYDPILLDLLQYYDQATNFKQSNQVEVFKKLQDAIGNTNVPAENQNKFKRSIILKDHVNEKKIGISRDSLNSKTQILQMGQFINKGVLSAAAGAKSAAVGAAAGAQQAAAGAGSFMGQMFFDQEKQFKKTPLHIATNNNESKLKQLFLNYMCKIKYKNENAFIDIFPQFLIQPGFLEYFDSLQFQTQALKIKSKLRVKEAYDENFIIKMDIQNCSYFDENFFKTNFNDIVSDDSQNQKSNKVLKHFNVDIQAMRVDWIVGTDQGKAFLQSMIQSENPEIYNNKAVTILINYLFSKFKYKILYTRLPLYFGQVATFILAMSLDDQVDIRGYIHTPGPKLLLLGFWVLIVIVTANIGIMLYQISKSHKVYFNQKWNYYEIMYIILIFYIAVNKLILYYRCTDTTDQRKYKRVEEYKDHHTEEMEEEDSLVAASGQGVHCVDIQRTNRKLEALLALVVWFKILFFLQLSDKFAPLVQVIYAIIWQIRFFAFIVLIIVTGFSNAFYLLGRNQMRNDGIPVGKHPVYSTIRGSIIYCFKLVVYLDPGLDNFDGSATYPPRNTMNFWLWIIWTVGVFVMIIHLFNMLIGMMGNIQGQETEKRQMYSLKYKLNVVVDNWWINAIDPKGLKYIISATKMIEDEEQDVKDMSQKKKEINLLREQIKRQMRNEVTKIKIIQDGMIK